MCAQNYFVFLFINLIQIKEKTHVPVAIHFSDYAFSENVHNMYCFHKWDVSLIHLFHDTQTIKKHVSLESLENLLSCLRNQFHWPIDFPAC